MAAPIYLDYNATTPVDPRVVERMVPFLHDRFGNASSAHAFGREAQTGVERARLQVAALINALPTEIVFTGGGSESDNLAIKGVVLARLERRPHVVSSAVDHPAVLSTLAYLRARLGADFTLVDVDGQGRVDSDEVRRAVTPRTVLITVMYANNEVGTLQPISEIGAFAREAGVLFHVDAAQAVGKVPIDVRALLADLLTVAGHKLYAPKGIGALYVRSGVVLDPLIHGAGQERGFRSGTENVASIVALGEACSIAREELPRELPRLTELAATFLRLLKTEVPEIVLNGHPTLRLPNTLNVSWPLVVGQELLDRAQGIAASTGAACHSGRPEPSSVLLAMGIPAPVALGAVRLSLGRWTTDGDIEKAAAILSTAYRSMTRMPAAPG